MKKKLLALLSILSIPLHARFTLESPDFKDQGAIATEFTCDGQDRAPRLKWKGAPKRTVSFALVCDDPDAPRETPWVHWVVYSIPKTFTKLSVELGTVKTTDDGIRQGTNDFKKIGYGGPCPPPGKPHRYYFTLYAVDKEVVLEPGATKKKLLNAIKGHTIGKARIMGTYQRKQ